MQILINEIIILFKKIGYIFGVFIIMLIMSTFANSVYWNFIFSLFSLFFLAKRRYIDSMSLFLLLFSFCYGSFLFLHGLSESIFDLLCIFICPISFYYYGNYIVDKLKNDQLLITFILITIFFFSLNLYISIAKDIYLNGFLNIYRQIEIYGRDSSMSATLLGLNASLGFVGIGLFFANVKFGTSLKGVLYILISLCSIITVLQLINRTGLVVAISTTLILILYNNRRNKLKILISIFFLFLIVLLLIKMGFISEELIVAYEDRNVSGDVSGGSGRFERWIDAIEKLFIYPIGWSTDSVTFNIYVHNFWLDIARLTGIIPFTLIVVCTFLSLKDLCIILKGKNTDLKNLLLGLNVCALLSISVEPVMEGFPLYFYIYSMLWGIQKKYRLINNN